MRVIEGNITPEIEKYIKGKSIDQANAFPVSTFRKLVEQVAKLSYLNKDYLLFYRGQDVDYKNKAGASTFYPNIYRGDYLPFNEVHHRFELLENASRKLTELFTDKKITGYNDIRRKKYIRWSILQHYGVCATPLLDFTHSLRVACSFAQIGNRSGYGYVFVYGLPYVTNRISINSEHDLVNVRLISICPPDALRPYFQDGYLVGTEDVTYDYDSKTELDFKNRLIAKFRIPTDKSFWERGFNSIPTTILFPVGDKVGELCQQIGLELKSELKTGELGEFIREWAELEETILDYVRAKKERVFSIREAILYLYNQLVIDYGLFLLLEDLRKFRNRLIHRPSSVKPQSLLKHLNLLNDLRPSVSNIIINRMNQ